VISTQGLSGEGIEELVETIDQERSSPGAVPCKHGKSVGSLRNSILTVMAQQARKSALRLCESELEESACKVRRGESEPDREAQRLLALLVERLVSTN